MFGFKPIWFYEVNLTDEITAANATIATDAEAAARERPALRSWTIQRLTDEKGTGDAPVAAVGECRQALQLIARAFSETGAAAWIVAVKKAVQPGRGLRHAGSGEAHAATRIASSLHPLAMPRVARCGLGPTLVCAMHRRCT